MRAGRIEQLDAPDRVYAAPASAYVASFIGQQNFLSGTAKADAVDTAVGLIHGVWGEQQVADGGAAVAAIRPEFIRIQPEGAGRAGR